jgi:hypothetical protein
MNTLPLYIVEMIGEVVAATDAALFADTATNTVKTAGKHLNYLYGRGDQIVSKLLSKDSAPTLKNYKYPLIALVQDFPEDDNRETNAYHATTLPSIIICTLTKGTDEVPKRYEQTFKPILYVIYKEFMKQLARHPANAGSLDPATIPHLRYDRPGAAPDPKSDFTDYLDIIELTNVEIYFTDNIIC